MSPSSKKRKQINNISIVREDVQWILVGEIYTTIRTIGDWVGEVGLTADKVYGDMACGGSDNDLLSSIGVGGILRFDRFVACSREY